MGLGDLVQKAVFLGLGVASYAGEKAGEKLGELRTQMQKLADEMVERGEMNADEARRFVDDMVKRAQQQVPDAAATPEPEKPTEPRKIEILDEDEPAATTTQTTSQSTNHVDGMRRQVEELQEELRRLKRN